MSEMDEALQCLVGDIVSEQGSQYKSTEVRKAVQPKLDLGLLTLQDLEPLTLGDEPGKLEDRLRNHARENAQYLLNRVWDLPTSRVQGELCAQLPPSHSRLPREKPIPKAKPLTKWEQYKKDKGFTTKKKKGKVWDEASQSWKPRYGYKRAQDETKDWLIEVPEGADPGVDLFAQRKEAKKERVAKNELQRLRNLARSSKASEAGMPLGIGGLDSRSKSREAIAQEVVRARKATASLGKFAQDVSRDETAPKNRGKKRKFAPNEIPASEERGRALKILDRLDRATPVVHRGAADRAAAKTASVALPRKEKRAKQEKKKRRSASGVHPRRNFAAKQQQAGKKAGKGGRNSAGKKGRK